MLERETRISSEHPPLGVVLFVFVVVSGRVWWRSATCLSFAPDGALALEARASFQLSEAKRAIPAWQESQATTSLVSNF